MKNAIRNVEYLKHNSKKKYSIIIPAAGVGYRMKSYGPKSLLKIKENKRLIDYQLEAINKVFNNKEIILVGGYQANSVFNHIPDNVIQIENQSYQNTNVSKSIAIGLRAATTQNVIIIYGDLFFTNKTINIEYKNKSFLCISNEMKTEEVGINIYNNNIVSLFYDIVPKWGQIMYLVGKELSLLKNIVFNSENDKMFGFQIINDIIDNHGSFSSVYLKHPVYDIDTTKDLKHVKEKYASYI